MGFAWAMMGAVLVVGLVAAARGRRGPARDVEVLQALGFRVRGGDGALTAVWAGRALVAEHRHDALHLSVPLEPAPLPYGLLARALGAGEALAALNELGAMAGADRLETTLGRGTTAKRVRRLIDRVIALAVALESLPRAEGMARWFLDSAGEGDRSEHLARLIGAYPGAPETLAACRLERDQPRDLRAAELARSHLQAFAVDAG